MIAPSERGHGERRPDFEAQRDARQRRDPRGQPRPLPRRLHAAHRQAVQLPRLLTYASGAGSDILS